MVDLSQIVFVFSSVATAEHRVAGIPAAARAAHALADLGHTLGLTHCTIIANPGWTPSTMVAAECQRLAPGLRLTFGEETVPDDAMIVRGEAFVADMARHAGARRSVTVLPALFDARAHAGMAADREEAGMRALRCAGRQILAATGKGGDGIVSRYVNRPISRAISHQLLRCPRLTPTHASLGTAVLGLVMALSLIFGGGPGLVAGALLFQAASIFDGVDGEMARATHRTSAHGATLDSIIDACTNLAFIAGAAVNVGLAGSLSAALAGGMALVALATGLFLIGRHADAAGEPVNFDVIKVHFRRGTERSGAMEWLIQLTMRDFFAAASAGMVLLGLTHFLLYFFGIVALGWLIVVFAVLTQATSAPVSPAHR